MLEEGDPTAITISPCIAAAWPSWCDSCRSVPCSIYCRADTAYLCGGCDTSIHSANSLARRHHRVPFQPLPTPPRKFAMLMEEKEEENGCFIGGEVDEYLDLVEFSSCEDEGKVEEKEKQKGWDAAGVVPVKCLVGGEEDQLLQSFQMGFGGFHGGMDYCSTTASSLGHNVPLSSMETAGAAESPMIGISSSNMMTSKGTMELFSGPHLQMPQAFSPMDREARVLRYREKKKTRKFQKIIRYASRKAYAETRPRIKGRFAKRTDAGHEADQMFAAPVMIEASYGAVPSY